MREDFDGFEILFVYSTYVLFNIFPINMENQYVCRITH